MKKTIKNIVVFASGSGSNAIKIYEYFQKDQSVNIEALYCNKKSAPVIQKFQNIGIRTIVFEKNNLDDGGVLKTLLNLNPSLIILAGFLLKMPEEIINNFKNRIINIHPALLTLIWGKRDVWYKHTSVALLKTTNFFLALQSIMSIKTMTKVLLFFKKK